MERTFSAIARADVNIDRSNVVRKFEGYRHTVGHGGINSFPLPPKVKKALAGLRPKLVRAFIQEYFNVLPEKGVYDWSKLDPYMESLSVEGSSVVASICVKPKVLFPQIDENVVMPNDINEWQKLVEAIVHRYSVEKNIVSHWEIANEPDIGENGGCPYKFNSPDEYNGYYKITAEAVLRACPGVKVGGPALAYAKSELMEGLLSYCSSNNFRLDFISWHCYSDDPRAHADNIRHMKRLAGKYYPGRPPEMMITEMSKGFDPVVCEETAFDAFRPATIAACVFAMMDEFVDYSFYYHIWDQVFIVGEFESFYKNPEIMAVHWNYTPHRFGLLGVMGEVRPAYFVYKALSEMSGSEVKVECASEDILVKSTVDGGVSTTMAVNYNAVQSRDMMLTLRYENFAPGIYEMSVKRIGEDLRYNETELDIIERRFIDVRGPVYFNVLSSAYSVAVVRMKPVSADTVKKTYENMK